MSDAHLNVDFKGQQRSDFIGRDLRRAFALVMSGVLAACSADRVDAPVVKAEPSTVDVSGTAVALTLPSRLGFSTYDGSGQVVHPDVVVFKEPWNGHLMWNAITPYPNSAIQFENPSLFASEDGDTWGIPDGVLNPLERTNRGYLSDPDMLFDAKSNQMWLYYREVQNIPMPNNKFAHLADHVWLTTSSDAVHWSSPRRVVTDSGHFVVSPSIVRGPNGEMSMYQVDAGRGGCSATATHIQRRRSEDGLLWSAASTVIFSQTGFTPWHLDVEYVESRHEYWALVAAYPPAQGCTHTSLFLATSPDGVNWTTYPTPVLAAGEIPQFGSAVYRSTFAFTSDEDVSIWYSGARATTVASKGKPAILSWSAAVTHTTATAVMNRVNDKSKTIKLAVQPTPGATTETSADNPP